MGVEQAREQALARCRDDLISARGDAALAMGLEGLGTEQGDRIVALTDLITGALDYMRAALGVQVDDDAYDAR